MPRAPTRSPAINYWVTTGTWPIRACRRYGSDWRPRSRRTAPSIPMAPNGGWNSTACLRIGVLERAAAATRNGAYRFAAHKAMNYLLYQNAPTLRDSYLKERETAPYIVLAWLAADDSIQPAMPPNSVLVTKRREVARISHRDKDHRRQVLARSRSRSGQGEPLLQPNVHRSYGSRQTHPAQRMGIRVTFFALVELVPTSFPFQRGRYLGHDPLGSAVHAVGDLEGQYSGEPECPSPTCRALPDAGTCRIRIGSTRNGSRARCPIS